MLRKDMIKGRGNRSIGLANLQTYIIQHIMEIVLKYQIDRLSPAFPTVSPVFFFFRLE